MRDSGSRSYWWSIVTVLAVTLVLWTPAATAQNEAPVTIDVTVSGNLVPGGRVTARAQVEIMDGSTVNSFSWTQTGGVPAKITGAASKNAKLVLAPAWRYRNLLFTHLAEPPVTQAQLPPNVQIEETGEGAFPGGLPDRFMVTGVNPFALEEAGLVILQVDVVTSSGTYSEEVEIHTSLPWRTSTGLKNVPIDVPVLLHGKDQGSYDWTLTVPAGSGASLKGNLQNPEFTPDVPGTYVASVTDEATGLPVALTIYAGTWRGVIVGQDMDGRPLSNGLCTACHSGFLAPDKFTPWAQTGHAEIFTNNLNTSTHYSDSCWSCHSVGYDPDHENNGFDEASDFMDFLGAGLLNNPGDNWTTVLDQFKETAQLANIQCENCHGPASNEPRTDTQAHGWRADVVGEPRTSLSSDVCATCHGEPLRHARFQQWQLSAHANYELAADEGESGSCSRCHTVNGFLKWLPILLDDDPATDPTANITVDWTSDEIHPQTCVTCHDPHNIGTTTGINTNAKIRISGNTPPLIAGFQVIGAGRGAICMTCHNSRRGLRNDANYNPGDVARAPHGSAQTDVLMGENAYNVNVGVRGPHSLIEDTCVNCHMEKTPPPEILSYNQGGTNHTFFASKEICQRCHDELSADTVQGIVTSLLDEVKAMIEDTINDVMAEQIAAGGRIDLGGQVTIFKASKIASIEFGESHGRQAITVTLTNGKVYGPVRLSDVDVIRPAPMAPASLYDFAGTGLDKAGWNWVLVNNDGSKGAHNPRFVLSVLDAARDAIDPSAGGPRSRMPWE